MRLSLGICPKDRTDAARLYWEAFGGKLGRIMGPDAKAVRFIEAVLGADHAICAHDSSGQLIGVAGFKTAQGALVGGGYREMARVYGYLGAAWRLALFAVLQREVDNQRFLMDGIMVADGQRGRGVGTALLEAVCNEARARGYDEVRLDVIDSNPRAKALYERRGFVAGKVAHIGPLRHVFGFGSAVMMVRRLR